MEALKIKMYNDIVLDHFSNPRNVGSLADADGIGRSGNSIDGDMITIYIRVYNETLYDVRFKTFGCAAAIAASSMLTVLATGKTLKDAMNISNDDVAEALGGLPPQKLKCSNIAADALQDAIKNYENKNRQKHCKIDNLPKNIDGKLTDISQGLRDRNQIQRYLRHIIMPKISGAGQKKLLETRVLLCAQSIDACDVLLNYMAASGIGQIYCYLESKNKSEAVLTQVHDLNPEVSIQLIEDMNMLKDQCLVIKQTVDFNILIGDFDFITRISGLLIQSVSHKFSPTLIAVAYGWQGYVNLFHHAKSIKDFLVEISKKSVFIDKISHEDYFQQLGMFMSYAFMGTLVAIELIKARLDIGNILKDSICFNLLETIFSNNISTLSCTLQNVQNFFNINDLKGRLSKAKVLVVGTGGLGCPSALALAKAGIGTIGLIDFDNVELSNLNRQILHTTSMIGLKKVESAKQALKRVNQNINIELYAASFSQENAIDIIKNYDIVIDGLDNLPTRYLLNDACFFGKKPFIEAGVLAFYGQITTIISSDGPCYRCIFPELSEPRSAPSCSETGVLGPVPGLMGVLQAVEVIKMIIGMNSNLKGGLLMYDALESEFSLVEFEKNNNCQLCGEHPSILKLGSYNFVCTDRQNNSNKQE